MADEERAAGECVPSTCLRCRRPVFAWTDSGMAHGGPVLFDLVGRGAGRILLVHGCCYEEGDDHDDGYDPSDDYYAIKR